jgi:hypothetical protein
MKKLLLLLSMVLASFVSYGQTNTIKLENEIDEIELPIFVLRYKGVILDVCPLEKDYNGDYDIPFRFTAQFKFKNNKVTKDELIELVSRYQFMLKGDYVIADKLVRKYLVYHEPLPTYLTIKKEVIRIK